MGWPCQARGRGQTVGIVPEKWRGVQGRPGPPRARKGGTDPDTLRPRTTDRKSDVASRTSLTGITPDLSSPPRDPAQSAPGITTASSPARIRARLPGALLALYALRPGSKGCPSAWMGTGAGDWIGVLRKSLPLHRFRGRLC